MKTSKLLIVLFAFFTFTNFTFATISKTQYKIIEDNLLVGLNTNNKGLKVSCIYFLGEIKSSKSLVPLMRILRNSDKEEERIAAAVALTKLDSDRGLFAVKQRIRFDDSERVKRLCKLFYSDQMLKKMKGKIRVEPLEVLSINTQYKDIQLKQFLN